MAVVVFHYRGKSFICNNFEGRQIQALKAHTNPSKLNFKGQKRSIELLRRLWYVIPLYKTRFSLIRSALSRGFTWFR
jgi:hypothetical protein